MIYVFVLVSTTESKNVKVRGKLRDLVHIPHFKGKLKSMKTRQVTSLRSPRVPRTLPLALLVSLSHILSVESPSVPMNLNAIAYKYLIPDLPHKIVAFLPQTSPHPIPQPHFLYLKIQIFSGLKPCHHSLILHFSYTPWLYGGTSSISEN